MLSSLDRRRMTLSNTLTPQPPQATIFLLSLKVSHFDCAVCDRVSVCLSLSLSLRRECVI